MEIAAEHPERQRVAARQDVEERFLLNGIARQSARRVAERDAQLSALIEPHPTNSTTSLANEAAVTARDAANLVVVRLPERADGSVRFEHVRQPRAWWRLR